MVLNFGSTIRGCLGSGYPFSASNSLIVLFSQAYSLQPLLYQETDTCLQIEILSSVVDGRRAYPAISGCLFHLTVDELNTLDNLRDELGALESAPVFLGIGGQFEYHGERRYA